MIALRDYQSAAVGRLRDAFRAGARRPVFVLPTGGGKTVTFAYMAARAAERGQRVAILAHRVELLDQISETLARFDVPHSLIAPGRPFHPTAPVFVASAFSVPSRLARIAPPELLIVDEAHHAVQGNSWGRVIAAWPDAHVIGVTATPIRMGGKGLGGVFDAMVEGPTVAELIDAGHLSPYRLFAPTTVDTSGLRVRGGDFVASELASACDRPTITGDAVEHYRRHADGRQAVVFCVSVEHARNVAAGFAGAGYAAASVDGEMTRADRSAAITAFRDRRTTILTSADLIGEGFDVPSIEAAVLLRPTMSLGLYLQQVGRALRVLPGKDHAVILDHAGNSRRHGMPCDVREWTLADRRRRRDGEAGSVATCPACLRVHHPAPVCPGCGHDYREARGEGAGAREVAQVDGVLAEVQPARFSPDRAHNARIALRLARRATSIDELRNIAREAGYKKGWAWHQWQQRHAAGATA